MESVCSKNSLTRGGKVLAASSRSDGGRVFCLNLLKCVVNGYIVSSSLGHVQEPSVVSIRLTVPHSFTSFVKRGYILSTEASIIVGDDDERRSASCFAPRKRNVFG